MKLLYLDFDGVLHDEEVWFHPKDGIRIHTEGRTLFEWSPILDQLLTPHPEVKIVLSTSWVRIRSFNFAKSKLSPELRERVIGATFHHKRMDSGNFQPCHVVLRLRETYYVVILRHGLRSMMMRGIGRLGAEIT